MNSQSVKVGERILALRLSRGMTREALAEKADISVQFLSDIEKGKKSMTVTTLRNLCNALSVSTDFVVNNIENTDTAIEIFSIVNTLPEKQQESVKKLILLFIESLSAE